MTEFEKALLAVLEEIRQNLSGLILATRGEKGQNNEEIEEDPADVI